MVDLTTSPAKHTDFDFCWAVYAPPVQALLATQIPGGWVDNSEKQKFETIWDSESTHLIFYDSKPVGWVSWRTYEDRVEIENLHIQPGYQRKTIGSIVVEYIAGNAKASAVPLEAEVLKGSSSIAFFERLNFTRSRELGLTIRLQRLC